MDVDAVAQAEDSTAFSPAEEEAIRVAGTASYDAGLGVSWHQFLRDTNGETPPTSSMIVPEFHDRNSDEMRSAEDAPTITPSTRPTSPGEGEEVPDEAEYEMLPPQENIAHLHMFDPITPPSIVEQACRHADQSAVLLTEEEFQRFKLQPVEAQKHAIEVYFRDLAGLGPYFGVTTPLSHEELFLGTF